MNRIRRASGRALLSLALLFVGALPLRADLVGWWPFDEDVDDYSGNENHGFHFAPEFNTDVPAAIGDGTSLALTGSDGVEILPHETLDSPVFTLALYVLDLGQSLPFARVTSRGSDTFELAVGTGAGGDEIKYYSPNNGWNATGQLVTAQTWHHVALVADGVMLTIYVDGEQAYGPVPFQAAPSGVFHIGNRWNNIEGFIGRVDDVALFDEPLGADEVRDLAELGVEEFLATWTPGEHAPTPPIGLRAFARDGEVEIGWEAVEGADTYDVYRSEVAGGPYDPLNTEPISELRFIDPSVENGTLYYYVVSASNEAGESGLSAEISVVPRVPIENPVEALVGWWPLDDEFTDRSIWGHDGVEVGFPIFDGDVPDAIADGTSLLLDGFSGVEIPASPRLDSPTFTFSMFVRDAGQTLPFARLASRGSDVFEIALGTGVSGDEYKFFSLVLGQWRTTSHPAPFDTWHHVAYVADGTLLAVYVDGELVYGPSPFASQPGQLLSLGIRWNDTEGFVGRIDDVALFDAPLTAEHIATIASSGTEGLVGDPGPRLPLPPANILAIGDEEAIDITWDSVTTASGYHIYRASTSGGPYERLNEEPLTTTAFTDTTMEPFVPYYYVVASVNVSGEGRISSETSAYATTEYDDPRDAIVGWWPFDGDLEDHSGNGLHGVFTAGTAVFDSDVPGAIDDGSALLLNGSGGVEIAPNLLLNAEVFTLSYFVRTAGQTAPYSRVTSRGNDTFETALGLAVDIDTMRYYSPANGWNDTVITFERERWEHVAWVADGLTISMYLNGALAYGPVDFTARPRGVLHIGNRWNNIEGLVGAIDDVALFRGALDEDALVVLAEEGVEALIGGAPIETRFLRADSNGDGGINLTDAIFTLGYLFLGTGAPPCLAAADANGDGNVNLSDATYSLGYSFLGGPPPPAPFPDCGPGNDSGDVSLGCEMRPEACDN